jgi:CPA2 family monovalent cation:H+ antiporter-2
LPDLFLLSILLIALGTALAAHLAGLPAPIGAFLAGMIVGESDFRHQVDEDIRPFRDVLLGLFFVTVGMSVDPSVLVKAPWTVIAWILVFIPGKALLMLALAAMMRYPTNASFRVAIILGHGGEFGLLLLTQAISSGLLGPERGQPILMALAVTMGLAPILIHRNGSIAGYIARVLHRIEPAGGEDETLSKEVALKNHVLVCGCGRVGRLITMVLEAANVPYIAIESDITRVRDAKLQGHRVMLGDATHRRILERAGVPCARLLVVTFDRRDEVDRLLHHAHHRNPGIPSVISVSDDRHLSEFTLPGATVVFPENHAVGLALADQALLLLGFKQEDAAEVVTRVRAELNPELRERVGV